MVLTKLGRWLYFSLFAIYLFLPILAVLLYAFATRWTAHILPNGYLYWMVDGAMAAANVPRLDEAAQTCGAGPATILWHVILPNIAPGIANGSMLVFATSFGEFALVQILVGARFETISLYSLDLMSGMNANFNILAVLTVLTFIIALVRTQLCAEIRRIQQAVNITTIYVTHDQAEAMAISAWCRWRRYSRSRRRFCATLKINPSTPQMSQRRWNATRRLPMSSLSIAKPRPVCSARLLQSAPLSGVMGAAILWMP
jgi:hypothetical protein